MKENTDFKMYFKTEILFFSICHAVEWNFGAGFVSDIRNANTMCWTRHSSRFSSVHLSCILYTFAPFVFCYDATLGAQSWVSAACALRSLVSRAGWAPIAPGFRAPFRAHPGSEAGGHGAPGSHTAHPHPASAAPPAFPVCPIWSWPDKEGGGGASALLLCPAGKWKEKKEGVFSLSHWIRWWIEQSRHGHDNLWRRFLEEASFRGNYSYQASHSQESMCFRSEGPRPILESSQYFLRNLRTSSWGKNSLRNKTIPSFKNARWYSLPNTYLLYMKCTLLHEASER